MVRKILSVVIPRFPDGTPSKYSGKSNINSKYIIYSDKIAFSLNFGIASGIINGKSYYYPETWFVRERDKEKYIENQDEFQILSIVKIIK